MEAKTPNLTEYIADLQHTVVVASLNYDIWWMYEENYARTKYISVLNRYFFFFTTSIHAHFVAMIIALYRLYETRSDTVNIPKFITLLELEKNKDGEKAISPTTIDSLRKKKDSAHPLWVKVCDLRNKVFAHRSNTVSVLDVFEKANVTPNEIKNLIALTKKMLNEATQAWNRNTHAFNLNARSDTDNLLSDLLELHETRERTFEEIISSKDIEP